VFWLLRFGDQLVNGLAREELVRQGNAPGVLESVPPNSNRKQGERASRDPSQRPSAALEGRTTKPGPALSAAPVVPATGFEHGFLQCEFGPEWLVRDRVCSVYYRQVIRTVGLRDTGLVGHLIDSYGKGL
jgi:hypothetical protein